MQHLTKLFTLLELTRNMPQHGYALSGISKTEQSDIAQHQYLTTLIAWQLARTINRRGGNVNLQRTMECALVHDVGELLGSDINFHYGRSNPNARAAAKNFEAENINFLSSFFERDQDYFKSLVSDFENIESDESIIAKTADLLECIHYKSSINKLDKTDIEETKKTLEELSDKCKNLQNGLLLKKIIAVWQENFGKETPIEIITGEKKPSANEQRTAEATNPAPHL